MPRRLVVLLLTLFATPGTHAATAVKGGTVPKNAVDAVASVLGDYEGQWDSELTEDPYDDISRYELTAPVMRLHLDSNRALRLTFFLDPAAAAADEPLDLLGFGCNSKVGKLLTLDVAAPPADRSPPYLVIAATFDFDWGRCPSRVHAVDANDLSVRIAFNESDREHVATLALLRNVQADHRVYVERDGVKREVKIRPKPDGTRSIYNREMEYCITDDVGEIEACYGRDSDLKRFIVPFPFPGISAAWYTEKSPDLKFERGKSLIYHQGVFRRLSAH